MSNNRTNKNIPLSEMWKKAQDSFVSKDYETAINWLNLILERDPKETNALINKGGALFYLERYKEALEIFETLLKLEPNNINALKNKAGALYGLGRYAEAVKIYDLILEKSPENVNILKNKALTLIEINKVQEAIGIYHTILNLEPTNIEIAETLVKLYHNEKEYEHEIEVCDFILEMDPQNKEIINKREKARELLDKKNQEQKTYPKGDKLETIASKKETENSVSGQNNETTSAKEALDLANDFYKKEDYKQALAFFDNTLRFDPKSIHALLGKGLSLRHLGRQDEALSIFDKVLEEDKENINALLYKADLFKSLDKHHEALSIFDTVLELEPNNFKAISGKEESYKLANAKDQANITLENDNRNDVSFVDISEAENTKKQEEEEEVEARTTLMNLLEKGVNLVEQGKSEEAINLFDRALKINSDHSDIYYYKGIALIDLQKYEEAIDCFDIVLKQDPSNSNSIYYKGVASNYLGRYEKAIEYFKKVLEVDPNDTTVLYHKAYALSMLGNNKAALIPLKKILQIDPQHERALDLKAIIYENDNKIKEAANCYKRLIDINPQNIEAAYLLAVAYRKLEKYEDSIKIFNQLLQDDPTNATLLEQKEETLQLMVKATQQAAPVVTTEDSKTASEINNIDNSSKINTSEKEVGTTKNATQNAPTEAASIQPVASIEPQIIETEVVKVVSPQITEAQVDEIVQKLLIRFEAQRAIEKETERLTREHREAQQREADRIAKEEEEARQKEADRIAKEELEAKQKELERIAKEELEAKQKELERIAKEEKEKLEAELKEAERIAQEEKEKLEAELKEAERIAQEEKEKLEAELKEAERIAQEEKEKQEAIQRRIEEAEKERIKQEELDREAQQKRIDFNNLIEKAKKLELDGDNEKLVDIYDQLIKIEPQNISIINKKAIAFRQLGKLDDAIKCHNRTLEIRPNFPPMLLSKAITLGEFGQLEEALQYYNKIISITPLDAKAQHNKAIISLKLNKLEEATDAFAKCGYPNLELMSLLGDFDNAFDLIDKIIDLNDNVYFNQVISKDDELRNAYKEIYLKSLKIVKMLHVDTNKPEEKLVAHYTSRQSIEKIFGADDRASGPSPFRLTTITQSYDYKESITLFNFLGVNSSKKNNFRAFVGCFSFDTNSLSQYNLYSTNHKNEITGGSIVLNNNLFASEISLVSESLAIKNELMPEDHPFNKKAKQSLYRCVYVDPKTGCVVSVGRKDDYTLARENKTGTNNYAYIDAYNAEKAQLIASLRTEFDELKALTSKDGLDASKIAQLLLLLRYLTKHVAFKGEQECRIISFEELADDNKQIQLEGGNVFVNYLRFDNNNVEYVCTGPMATGYESLKDLLNLKANIETRKCDHPFASDLK